MNSTMCSNGEVMDHVKNYIDNQNIKMEKMALEIQSLNETVAKLQQKVAILEAKTDTVVSNDQKLPCKVAQVEQVLPRRNSILTKLSIVAKEEVPQKKNELQQKKELLEIHHSQIDNPVSAMSPTEFIAYLARDSFDIVETSDGVITMRSKKSKWNKPVILKEIATAYYNRLKSFFDSRDNVMINLHFAAEFLSFLNSIYDAANANGSRAAILSRDLNEICTKVYRVENDKKFVCK